MHTNTIELPDLYTPPELQEFGPLRQMIRGAGSPTRADFSSLDNDTSDDDNICIGEDGNDGNDLADAQCDQFFPF